MKLFLSGGGSGEQTRELDKLFANSVDKRKNLLYIPIAIDTEKHPYPECLKWLRGTFELLGINKYNMLTEKEITKSKTINLEGCGGIYIGGGNTPYLLKMLKESGFWALLKKAMKENIPIYGGSAGAIIFSKSIIPSLSSDENKVGLKDFSGMNVLNSLEMWCHYEASKDDTINRYIKEYNLIKVIALSEETGLEVTDKKIKVIGKKNAFLFSDKKKLEITSGSLVSKH